MVSCQTFCFPIGFPCFIALHHPPLHPLCQSWINFPTPHCFYYDTLVSSVSEGLRVKFLTELAFQVGVTVPSLSHHVFEHFYVHTYGWLSSLTLSSLHPLSFYLNFIHLSSSFSFMISPFFNHASVPKCLLCLAVMCIATSSVWVPLTFVDAFLCQTHSGAVACTTSF